MKNDICDEFIISNCSKCNDEYEKLNDLVCVNYNIKTRNNIQKIFVINVVNW